mmetsp:Transcript_22827/g.70144  ORF Transcript_22827/g.70144 Transcript_22827/m.70144 type:complete len:104 (+) Transcript_22827:101-412(+)
MTRHNKEHENNMTKRDNEKTKKKENTKTKKKKERRRHDDPDVEEEEDADDDDGNPTTECQTQNAPQKNEPSHKEEASDQKQTHRGEKRTMLVLRGERGALKPE